MWKLTTIDPNFVKHYNRRHGILTMPPIFLGHKAMKYVSIDLETTGLSPRQHQILEFGAVIEDTENVLPIEELPSFHSYIKWDTIIGDPYALAMNWRILDVIAKPQMWEELGVRVLNPEDLGLVFWDFIDKHFNSDNDQEVFRGKITVAGKNFGNFDNQFLENLPNFFRHVRFEHRFLDPGSMYFNPKIDSKPPGLETCLERIGIRKGISHTAVEDAKDVIMALRGKLKYDGK